MLRGIEVNDDTIALDLMLNVGPGGDYLGEEHTIRYMRNEFSESTVSSQVHRDEWERTGERDTVTRAGGIAKELLNYHTPLPIDSNIEKQIRNRFPAIQT